MNYVPEPAGLRVNAASPGITLQRFFLSLFLLLGTLYPAFSQTVAVRGQVLNEAGSPIQGATVQVRNTAAVTTTDSSGAFSLSAPAGSTLVISYVGYTPQQVAAAASVTVALQPLNNSLGEVVVVGYGTQRRVSVTGSVDRIGAEAIEGKPVANLSQALQGVSPNLIIQQRSFEPGQGLNINIRGLGTLGNNDPLVVIDGIVGGDINLLNPADVESISVLKDAGTAAIYGSRAANGVLLITTKRGRKNEKPSLIYDGTFGITSPKIMAKPVDAWENMYYKNESLVNSGRQPAYSPSEIQAMAARGNGDWSLSSILQKAAQQNHSISIRGGGATNTYLLSFGYMNQENNFIGPNYGWKRYNIRLNQTSELGRFRLNTVLSYVKSDGKDHSSNAST
ncbi:MAG TPA: TonB-dependent receptor plug domain-containing protein, partial [Chitinophagaceae bacterium]|nr:TonB-dependent receptor plug domain-containing protein [Chitinophagaceae bacterium]